MVKAFPALGGQSLILTMLYISLSTLCHPKSGEFVLGGAPRQCENVETRYSCSATTRNTAIYNGDAVSMPLQSNTCGTGKMALHRRTRVDLTVEWPSSMMRGRCVWSLKRKSRLGLHVCTLACPVNTATSCWATDILSSGWCCR